jgi:hypothetical protein
VGLGFMVFAITYIYMCACECVCVCGGGGGGGVYRMFRPEETEVCRSRLFRCPNK